MACVVACVHFAERQSLFLTCSICKTQVSTSVWGKSLYVTVPCSTFYLDYQIIPPHFNISSSVLLKEGGGVTVRSATAPGGFTSLTSSQRETSIMNSIQNSGASALTQVPQRIDGLWLGRPGSVLHRGCFLSVAQHIAVGSRAVFPPQPPVRSLWLSCGRAERASSGDERSRGWAVRSSCRRTSVSGSSQAAPHAFILEEDSRRPACWCHRRRINVHRAGRVKGGDSSARWLPVETFKIIAAEGRSDVRFSVYAIIIW